MIYHLWRSVMLRPEFRRLPVIAAVAALALGLTSCGDDGGSPAGSGDHGLGKATIVLGGKVITWAPAYVAVCQGYFKDHGLDVSLTVSPQGTTSAIAGLVSGDALAALTGAPPAVAPIREGAPVQMLFNASLGYSVQVVGSKKMLAAK